MKKICFFSGDITRSGGTERVGTIIANELQKDSELEVSFVSLWEKEETPFFEIDNSIKRNVLYEKETKGVYHFFGYIRRLRKFLKKNNVDVLIDIDGILDMYSIPACIGLETKVISWEHFGFYSNPFVKYRKITRRMAARWADAIVVLTEKDKTNYKKNLHIKHNITKIGNPVVKSLKCSKYSLESKQICSVGRLSYDKGYDYLMEVAKIVFKKHKDWTWIIAGEGEERDFIQSKIREYKLGDNLKLVGRLNDLEKVYSESAMLVSTSRYEGFGMMILEAMSYGVPCVSFKCPEGPEELIEDGINGNLVECFDIEKMAKEINKLIENEPTRKTYSDNCVNTLERYDMDNIVSKWKILIKRM